MLEHEAGTRTMGKNDEAQEWEMTEEKPKNKERRRGTVRKGTRLKGKNEAVKGRGRKAT